MPLPDVVRIHLRSRVLLGNDLRRVRPHDRDINGMHDDDGNDQGKQLKNELNGNVLLVHKRSSSLDVGWECDRLVGRNELRRPEVVVRVFIRLFVEIGDVCIRRRFLDLVCCFGLGLCVIGRSSFLSPCRECQHCE